MRAKAGVGAWVLIAVLLALLALAAWFAVSGWETAGGGGGGEVSTMGYLAMALGIVVTLALGIGLMMLVFRSGDRP